MRLATFKANGRVSYGAVTDDGIVDHLGRKLARFPTLLDVLRAQAVPEARAAAEGPADYQPGDVEFLPPIPAPDKNICVGINYPDRSAEYKDGPGGAQVSQPVLPLSRLAGRQRPADRAPQGFRQVRLRRRGGAGDRPGARHVPRESALSMIGGLTLGSERRSRLVASRHLERDAGQEFRQVRQRRPGL